MSNHIRRITRRSFSSSEKARAHQTGVPVQQLRDEETRFAAADVLQRLLDEDKEQRTQGERDCFLLSTEQRHALHVAVGTLRKRPERPGEA